MSVVPVMKLASSDARNDTAAATSSGLPILCEGQKGTVDMIAF